MITRRLLLAAALASGVTLAAAAPALPAGAATTGTGTSLSLSLPGVTTASSSTGDDSAFLTAALTDVDGYWTRIFKDENLGTPSVRYDWIPGGQSVTTACSNQPTDDTAAFYCPADDTIYLSEVFADAVRDSKLSQWPSGDRPQGALGDMAVAYVIAHEEGHEIQDELGLDQGQYSTESLELHADCLAGAWAGDAHQRGVAQGSDVDTAKATAWLVGDYAFDNPGHHGTPAQREQAFSDGYQDLSSCQAYLS